MAGKKKPVVEVYDVAESVKRGAKKTARWARKHPWKSAGIVALLGALFYRLFFRKRR